MSATILTSVLAHGGRTSRYGEFTIVHMHGCSFVTTPLEFMQMQNWARGRVSSGNPVRDRATFLDRFETVVGRAGGGVATRGNRSVLARIVKAMKANAVFIEEWMVPHDLEQSMEMKRPKGWVPGARTAAVEAAPEPANDAQPSNVTPLVPK